MKPTRIAAVVLAAGMSRRMGRPKALLPLGGLPLIVRVVEPILATQIISPIVVVTGHHADQVERAMDGCDVQFVHNAGYEEGGMLSSVKAGVRAIVDQCDAFFLVLGDQPLVQSSTFEALIASTCDMGLWPMRSGSHGPEARVTVAQPKFEERRGHPILISSDCIDEILSIPSDETLKSFTHRTLALEICVDDPGVVTDVDTPQDYDRAVEVFSPHRSELCQPKL